MWLYIPAVFAWTSGFWTKIITMSALGVGVGMFFTSYCLVVVEVLGLPLLAPMLSISGLLKGITVLAFGPFVGKCHNLSSTL